METGNLLYLRIIYKEREIKNIKKQNTKLWI